jgi:predicted branched-subunit amino acid permease
MLVGAAVAVVGASFGAIAVSAGMPWYLPAVLSVVVFAGAAQFVFVGIAAAGGSVAAAVVAGLLVNLRHLPFGFAVGDILGSRWRDKLLGSYLMIDETVAFCVAETDRAARRVTYWVCGCVLFLAWNLGVLAGTFGGGLIGDPAALGLDAAFPAVLFALILPSLSDPVVRRSVVVGAVVAVAAAPFLPAGVPVLLATAGLLTGLIRRSRRPAPHPTRPPAGTPHGCVS